MLIINKDELYTDVIYKKDGVNHILYTGIGKIGNQDSVFKDNGTISNCYNLNMEVLSHFANEKALLVFNKEDDKKNGSNYECIGEYQLVETHQNVQPDDNGDLRRVFVFHLKEINADKDVYDIK